MTKSRLPVWLLAAALGLGAVAYTALGLYCLVFDTSISYPMDIRLRWVEQNLLYRGLGFDLAEPGAADVSMEEFVHGRRATAYPPWTYTTNWLLYPPLSWQPTRVYYAALCVLALGVMAAWGYRQGAAFGPHVGALAAASLLAMFPTSICLSYGQYGVVVAALLIGCFVFCESGWDYAAGLCLGLALVKPQLSGLCLVGLFLRGRFRVVFTAAGYLIAASALTWALTGGSPPLLMSKLSQEAEAYFHISHNPLIVLLKPLLGLQAATLLLASAGTAVCAALVWFYGRKGPLLTTFSICIVVSMFWSYRRHYDAGLMCFLFLALLLQAWRTGSRLSAAMYVLMGLTLWAPVRLALWDERAVQFAYGGLWVAALAVLIAVERRATRPAEAADLAPAAPARPAALAPT